ncbi:carbohydrate binding domain-containing protein [Actinoplanes sp. NPDC048796]|uniref:carbohydrate binding domain-containing protein n=1 Tax=unclassified Actinoplanes TaxID=2626549 RepID=UPI0033C6415E
MVGHDPTPPLLVAPVKATTVDCKLFADRSTGGAWTTAPGVAMGAAERAGWYGNDLDVRSTGGVVSGVTPCTEVLTEPRKDSIYAADNRGGSQHVTSGNAATTTRCSRAACRV